MSETHSETPSGPSEKSPILGCDMESQAGIKILEKSQGKQYAFENLGLERLGLMTMSVTYALGRKIIMVEDAPICNRRLNGSESKF
jgi:hypothetical protein